MPTVPDWMLPLIRDFPIAVLVLLAAGYIIKIIRDESHLHTDQMSRVNDARIASKEAEVARLVQQNQELMQRLEKMLVDHHKERERLYTKFFGRRDKS